jgi:hypothetical protein
MALSPASATYACFESGVITTALGVAPHRSLSSVRSRTRCSARRAVVSTTVSASSFASATNTCLPSCVKASAVGWSPTITFVSTDAPCEPRASTDSEFVPWQVTNARSLALVTTTSDG